MISSIDRINILQYQRLASYVAMLQADVFDDELEFVESEIEKQRVIELYDAVDYFQPNMVKDIDERVFYYPTSNLLEYPTLISNALQRFFRLEEISKFYMLPHIKGSIVSNVNSDYKPLSDARQVLREANSKGYKKEAYEIRTESIRKIVQSLFWIVRCDASVPRYIFIQPAKHDYFMSLCKYGNLHLYIPPESDRSELLDSLRKSGLQEWQGKEYERFSDSGAIEGRFTVPEK